MFRTAYKQARYTVPLILHSIRWISHAGDSHSAAVTEQGAVWAWGTYRDTTGVYGFSPNTRIALMPTLVWDPKKADDQAVKIASGKPHSHSGSVKIVGGSVMLHIL